MAVHRVLVADDDDDERLITSLLVRSVFRDTECTGHLEVVVVSNGEAAIAEIQREPYDLVLTDLNMGVGLKDGFDVARSAYTNNVRCFIVTNGKLHCGATKSCPTERCALPTEAVVAKHDLRPLLTALFRAA